MKVDGFCSPGFVYLFCCQVQFGVSFVLMIWRADYIYIMNKVSYSRSLNVKDEVLCLMGTAEIHE